MNVPMLIDETLEALVVRASRGSASPFAVGCSPGSPYPSTLFGRTVLLTGPTSGLGRTAAHELAGLGARVVLVGRSRERLAEVRNALIAEHGEDRFPVVVADMDSLASVRAATAEILRTEARLDVIVDNAGAVFPTRREPDGIEATLATMVVGPFALIGDLLPLLRSTPGSRVIAVTSGGMYAQGLHLEDLQWTAEPFQGTRAYARAKRAQVVLMREWARRIPPRGRDVHRDAPRLGRHAGPSASLPGFARAMKPILRTPAEGADTIVWLAAAPASR